MDGSFCQTDELVALLILPPKDPSLSSDPLSRHQRHDPQQVAVLEEHLVEYHLRHDSDAVPHFRSIVEKLRAEPDLVSTVVSYFSNDFRRRETARQLHVHPNTVDNRLTRIKALTGVNPRTARGLLLLGAAFGVAPAHE